MRSTGMTFSKWFTCALCGREYPERYKTRQRGFDVCTYLPCLDDVVEVDASTSALDMSDAEDILDARR